MNEKEGRRRSRNLEIKKAEAEQCLIDNGIDQDEASTVLQALGYILLDKELYQTLQSRILPLLQVVR